MVLKVNATEQRVSGGRLYIQNVRDLRTKVMSNGVEVIVRGSKTAAPIGISHTPFLPQRVGIPAPTTLPGHTLSRFFHMKENPSRSPGGIGQILSSIVKSAKPALVTKTLLTTFTYKTTILRRTNTIIKSHEEIVSNVVTQKPLLSPTKAPEPVPQIATTLAPSLEEGEGTTPFVTLTLSTTYTYYNTFTVRGSLPIILTSRETLSNLVTLPSFMAAPTSLLPPHTETHYSTYLFSKTLANKDVTTTKETVTQVVVTQSQAPVSPSQDKDSVATRITTFTGPIETTSQAPVVPMVTVEETRTLTPVLLQATKVYFTTYTHFTTLKNPLRTETRTEVVSRTMIESHPTALDTAYVNRLKESYLQEHSTLLEVNSKVEELTLEPTRVTPILETAGPQRFPPHWPKDDDQLSFPVQPSLVKEEEAELLQTPSRPPTISSSEEHFDEVKEGVQKVVSVLTNDKRTSIRVKPTKTEDIRLDVVHPTLGEFESGPEPFTEEVVGQEEEGEILTERPVSHLATPPLLFRTSTERSEGATSKGPLALSKIPILEQNVDLNLFPEIGKPPPPPPIPDVPEDSPEYQEEDGDQEQLPKPDPTTKEILSLINDMAASPTEAGESSNEDETEKPPKIYNIPTTFDTQAFNEQQQDLLEESSVQNSTEKEKDRLGVVAGNSTELSVSSLPSHQDEDEEKEDSTEASVGDELTFSDDLNNAEKEASQRNSAESELEEVDTTVTPYLLEEIEGMGGPYNPENTELQQNSTSSSEQEEKEEEPAKTTLEPVKENEEIEEDFELEDDTDTNPQIGERNITNLSDLQGIFDSGELEAFLTTKRPVKTTKKPPRKKPTPPIFASSEESGEGLEVVESTTKTNQRNKVKFKNKTNKPKPLFSSEEDDASSEHFRPKPHKDIHKDSEESDSESEEEKNKRKKGKKKKKNGESPVRITSNPGYSGPSKSAISFPLAAAGAGGAASAVGAATTAFNWKPLLNLGALGLGGLGASKLGPLFNSISGYMKSAVLPTSRNDTDQRRRKPVKELRYKSPVYIPLKNPQNYRFSDYKEKVRRPQIQEYHHDTISWVGREPDYVSGPLPPPIHHHFEDAPGEEVEVPNFHPPENQLPNYFQQREPSEGSNPHKNGKPSPEPVLEYMPPPQGKTEYNPGQNYFERRPVPVPSQTPILRPLNTQGQVQPVQRPLRPLGFASIEMINNEIKQDGNGQGKLPVNAEIFLPQRRPQQQQQYEHREQRPHPPPASEGPLRINIPGLNIHDHHQEGGIGVPWGPPHPSYEDRFQENPFKEGNLNPPRIVQSPYGENEAEPSSHESFDHGNRHGGQGQGQRPSPQDEQAPFFNQQGFITRDHFDQFTKHQQGQREENGNNGRWPPLPKLRPPPPPQPPQPPPPPPIFQRIPPENFHEPDPILNDIPIMMPPPSFSFNSTHSHQFTPPTPPPIGRLPPWPEAGPGPGQVPGRFPGPLDMQTLAGLKEAEKKGSFQRIVDPPYLHRKPPPSTVYIVEGNMEVGDEFPDDVDNEPEIESNIRNHKVQGQNQNTLIIKEITTTPRTTPRPLPPVTTFKPFAFAPTSEPTTVTPVPPNPPAPANTTNRALISRLFIRRFTTTTPLPTTAASEPPSTPFLKVFPPFIPYKNNFNHKTMPTTSTEKGSEEEVTTMRPTNTLKELLSFEQIFKQKYGPKSEGKGQSQGQGSLSSAESKKVNVNVNLPTTTEGQDRDVEEYLEDEDDESHPNHHPVYKPPIDVTKYLKDVDEDEFGQLYQGTEDKDTVIDPKDNRVIQHPLLKRISTTSTSKTVGSEQERKDLIFTSTPPAGSPFWWPTTYRPSPGRPTTYHPRREEEEAQSLRRPAPQEGMASFYDDPDAMNTINMKNKEILKESSKIALVKPSPLPPTQLESGSYEDEEDEVVIEEGGGGQGSKIKIQMVKPDAKGENGEVQIHIGGDENEGHEEEGKNGIRESSYIYEEEEYGEEDAGEDQVQVSTPSSKGGSGGRPREQSKIIFAPKPSSNGNSNINNLNLNIGGHKSNNLPPTIHFLPTRGQSQGQGQGQQEVSRKPLIPSMFDVLNNRRKTYPNIKTEMEPPPIDSTLLKSPILELPSSGPIHHQNNQGGVADGGGNRGTKGKGKERPNLLRPKDHLFAPEEKRVTTTHTIASLDHNNQIVSTATFMLPPPTPTVSGNRTNPEYDEDEEEGEEKLQEIGAKVIIPTKASIAGSTAIVKYTGGRLETATVSVPVIQNNEASYENEDEYYEDETYSEERPSTTTATTSTTPTTKTSTGKTPPITRFRSTTTKATPTTTVSAPPTTRRVLVPFRRPPLTIPWTTPKPRTGSSTYATRNNTNMVVRFSSTISSSSANTTGNNSNERVTSTQPSSSSTSSTRGSIKLVQNEEKGREATRPPFIRRPLQASSEENKRRIETLLSRFVPTTKNTPTTTSSNPSPATTRATTTTASTTTTQKRPVSVFQNLTTTAGTPSPPISPSEEYEEYSYEEEEHQESQPNATAVSVVTQVSAEISPSRVPPRRKDKEGVDKGSTATPHINYTVTRAGSVTQTVTETELIPIYVTDGVVRETRTVVVTKTIPPETLVSTVVGTVTLVSRVDIQPTVVRSTVSPQPTGTPISTFVSEETSTSHESGTTRVGLGGLMTKGKFRPATPVQTTPPEVAVNKRPVEDCSLTCPTNGNQHLACRTYRNGTKAICDCKPGYARIKEKFPCRPTYTYELAVAVKQMEGHRFDLRDLGNAESSGYAAFLSLAKEAIDRAFLSTDIKRQFQGSQVLGLDPVRGNSSEERRVGVGFLVQLTTNITEDRIKGHFLRGLKASNFSLGMGSGVLTTRDPDHFSAQDFDECSNPQWNDCSPFAECMNLRGSFSCACRPGFKDRGRGGRRPGRDCVQSSGCAACNFHGTCHQGRGGVSCHCFKWYAGAQCQISLKFLLVAVLGVGSVLFLFVMLCATMVCRKRGRRRQARPERTGSGRFMRYRSPNSQATMEIERAAIMNSDGSSDGRQTPQRIIAHHSFTPDSLLVDVDPKMSGMPLPLPPDNPMRHHSTSNEVNLINFSLRNVVNMDEGGRRRSRSRSPGPALIIPRAKIKSPSRPASTHTLHGNNGNVGNEERLIHYLEPSHSPKDRKFSLQEPRRMGGALVSSGDTVSAIGGVRRKSATALELTTDPTYSAYSKSVSEVRSVNETIRFASKPTPSSATDTSRGSCKPPSYCAYSETHTHTNTMGDKDGASTVYTTKGKLFRIPHSHSNLEDTSSTASSQ